MKYNKTEDKFQQFNSNVFSALFMTNSLQLSLVLMSYQYHLLLLCVFLSELINLWYSENRHKSKCSFLLSYLFLRMRYQCSVHR